MSDFNLKDIPQLTETNTLDGTAKLAIAVPTGVGSDHNLRYIQKGVLARFDGTAVPTRMEFTGASRVMNFNGFADSWLEYFTPSQALYLRGQILGVSPDGSTIPARLESNGSVVGSNIKVTNGGNTYDVTFGGGSDETASFTEGGNIQVNPKTTAITPDNGINRERRGRSMACRLLRACGHNCSAHHQYTGNANRRAARDALL